MQRVVPRRQGRSASAVWRRTRTRTRGLAVLPSKPCLCLRLCLLRVGVLCARWGPAAVGQSELPCGEQRSHSTLPLESVVAHCCMMRVPLLILFAFSYSFSLCVVWVGLKLQLGQFSHFWWRRGRRRFAMVRRCAHLCCLSVRGCVGLRRASHSRDMAQVTAPNVDFKVRRKRLNLVV